MEKEIMTDTSTIYKYDTKGKLRTWRMEIDGGRYRTISGTEGGKPTESNWTEAKPKNVGRANETTAAEQAALEVASKYENKLTREYHRTVEEAKDGAHFFKPMLAQSYKGFELWNTVFAQPKLDGMRCIATKAGLFSRQGKPILGCPHIFKALAPAFEADPGLILDGELYNHELKDDFPKLMSLCKKADPDEEELAESRKMVQYHVYDCPSKATYKFSTRITYLGQLFQDVQFDDCIRAVPTVAFDGQPESAKLFDEFHGKCVAAGYEGSMLRIDQPYEQKRSKNLLKRKDFIDAEFEVIRLEEGKGNWSGAIKSVVCKAANGQEFGAGLKGSRDYAVSLIGKSFKTATVRFFELTPDGIPRFGIVTALFEGERDV